VNKLATTVVGDVISGFAQSHVRQMTQAVAETVEERGLAQAAPTAEQVQKIAIAMTTQDTTLRSKRVWAFAIPVVSTLGYALLDPSLIAAFVTWLQAHPGAWWGVAANVVAVTLPIISKALDKRPTA
jgi:hypothetical protein